MYNTNSEPDYHFRILDILDVSDLIRDRLNKCYTGHSFSVRSVQPNKIEISWIDGPSRAMVSESIEGYFPIKKGNANTGLFVFFPSDNSFVEIENHELADALYPDYEKVLVKFPRYIYIEYERMLTAGVVEMLSNEFEEKYGVAPDKFWDRNRNYIREQRADERTLCQANAFSDLKSGLRYTVGWMYDDRIYSYEEKQSFDERFNTYRGFWRGMVKDYTSGDFENSVIEFFEPITPIARG